MRSAPAPWIFLTDSGFRLTVFLTFLLTLLSCACEAEADNGPMIAGLVPSDASSAMAPTAATLAANARHQMGQLIGTLRQQAPLLLPGLPVVPQALRDPGQWAHNNLQEAEQLIGFDGFGDNSNEKTPDNSKTTIFAPLAALIEVPQAEQAEALWLSPNYHHQGGVLPFHDTLLLGFGVRHALWDQRLRLDIRPYYGQNWVSPQGYWGTDLSASFGPTTQNGQPVKPWGKISMGFIQGDSTLMDHGHGFTMHSEWNLADHYSLTAGIRSTDATRTDNYVMMRWNLLGN